ncbi:hypothetical protein CcrBL47_gp388 [Caulobacter phage BL47]|nr:hypothetical protein CcrBL47_gp388 [Caulobacter phage BL47]
MVFFDQEETIFDGKMSHFEDAFGGVGGDFYAAWQFAAGQGWGTLAYHTATVEEVMPEAKTEDMVRLCRAMWSNAPSRCWRAMFTSWSFMPPVPFYPVPKQSRHPRANWLIDILRATEPDLLIDRNDPLDPGSYDRKIVLHGEFDPERLLAVLDAFEYGDRDYLLQTMKPLP